MRAFVAALLLGVSTLPSVARASELSLYASCLDDIVRGSPDRWTRAVNILTSEEDVFERTLDTLLPRVEQFAKPEQERIAKELRPFIDREDVALALAAWVRGDDPELAHIAAAGLRQCTRPFCVGIALELLTSGKSERLGMLDHLIELYANDHSELAQHSGSVRQWTAQQLSAGVRDDRFVTPWLSHLDDPDAKFRLALVRALRDVVDERVRDVFAALAGDPDAKIRSAALFGLAKRGDDRVYERLVALAPPPDPESGSRYQRNLYFSDLGYAYWWDLENLTRRYRAAATDDERREHARILWAASEQLRDGFPEFDPLIESLADDADPRIAEIMSDLRARRQRAASDALDAPGEDAEPAIARWALVGMTFVTGVLGVVLFSLAFRLMKLKFILTRLPLSKIRSASQGMVAVRGRVVPAEGALLEYPSTDEACAYYPGIEKKRPGFAFILEDETGRIRVETAGSVLLSEQRLLLPDDDVHIIASVLTRQSSKPDGQVISERVLAKPAVRRSAYQRLMHFIIDRMLAANARGGHSRMLFTDPRSCFWIWDDPRDRPLSGAWDLAATIAVVALLGAWLAVFALCGLAILDQEYARMLAGL